MKWVRWGIVFFTIVESISTQQGYNYPKPETPFPGGSTPANRPAGSLDSGPLQPSRPDTFLGSTGSQPPQQQAPGRPIFDTPQYSPGTQQQTSRFPSPGGSSTGNQQGYNYPAPQKPYQGQPGPEQKPFNEQQNFGSSPAGQYGSGQQRPTGGQSTQAQFPPIRAQQPSTGLGTSPTQSSSRPQGPGQTGAYPGTSGSTEVQFRPQIPSEQGGYSASSSQGHSSGGYPSAGRPTGPQFPPSRPQAPSGQSDGYPSSGGYPSTPQLGDLERPQQSQFSSNKPQISSGQSGSYPGSTLAFPGQQKGSGGYSNTVRPQFPTSGINPSGTIPQQSVGGSGKPQFPSDRPQIPSGPDSSGQQRPGQYPGSGRPTGFPIPESQSSGVTGRPQGSQFPSGGSQGTYPQRPSSDYLPPEQGSGKFPATEKPTSPQFPSSGSGQTAGTGVSSNPSEQSTYQSGYDQSRPGDGRQPGFPSGGTQRPTGQFDRPGGQPNTQFPLPSTGISRPGGSSETDISRPQPEGDFGSSDATPNFPSRPQIGQGSFPGQQGSPDTDDGKYEGGDYSAIPGQPDVDYPVLSSAPETSFRCDDQQFPGYYADVETRCQAFHICANNRTYDFLCPNGTIFHQEYLVCVWWNQFDCNTASSLYGINENIYDFSITGVQQTGGIPIPGVAYPDNTQIPIGQPQLPSYPSRPGESRSPGEYPSGISGQTPGGVFPSPSVPQIPAGGYPSTAQTSGITPQRPGGFSKEPRPQEPSFPPLSRPQQTPAQSNGYPSGIVQSGTGSQSSEEYPGIPRPQGSTFPSGSGSGFQRPGEISTLSVGGGAQTSSGYPDGGVSHTQTPGGYPSGRPSFPPLPQTPGGGSGSADRYPNERPQAPDYQSGSGTTFQRPGGFLARKPQTPVIGRPEVSSSTQQMPGGIENTGGYPSGRPQDSSQGLPSQPRPPFPGSPTPHQPTRDYLPPAIRK